VTAQQSQAGAELVDELMEELVARGYRCLTVVHGAVESRQAEVAWREPAVGATGV
jgi:DNA-nicking Smr family endonuclease